jgi:hypothetical protein
MDRRLCSRARRAQYSRFAQRAPSSVRRPALLNLCSGKLAPVLETLEYLKHETTVWFEITTLLIPGENDSVSEIEAESAWMMGHLGPDVPLRAAMVYLGQWGRRQPVRLRASEPEPMWS